MTQSEILALITSNRTQISQFGVERIGIFGSVVRSEQHQDSDLDIIVSFTKGEKTFDNYMGLRFYLEDLFPGRKIDLVVEETLKPRIKASISKDTVYAT
jgi:uncharacterized protein